MEEVFSRAVLENVRNHLAQPHPQGHRGPVPNEDGSDYERALGGGTRLASGGFQAMPAINNAGPAKGRGKRMTTKAKARKASTLTINRHRSKSAA